jgi:hypothetical protein
LLSQRGHLLLGLNAFVERRFGVGRHEFEEEIVLAEDPRAVDLVDLISQATLAARWAA